MILSLSFKIQRGHALSPSPTDWFPCACVGTRSVHSVTRSHAGGWERGREDACPTWLLDIREIQSDGIGHRNPDGFHVAFSGMIFTSPASMFGSPMTRMMRLRIAVLATSSSVITKTIEDPTPAGSKRPKVSVGAAGVLKGRRPKSWSRYMGGKNVVIGVGLWLANKGSRKTGKVSSTKKAITYH